MRRASHIESLIYLPHVSAQNRDATGGTTPLTARQKRELEAVSALPDKQIDTSDIPELPPSAWKDAVRGRFYRPVKQAVSLRLDADVVAWLKKRGKGYQTRVNHILRERMLTEMQKAGASKQVESFRKTESRHRNSYRELAK